MAGLLAIFTAPGQRSSIKELRETHFAAVCGSLLFVTPRASLCCIAAAGIVVLLLIDLIDASGQSGAPSQPVFRSFQRVQLLEDKGETSASVSVGDLNGDGLLDIVLAKGRHWPLHSRVLMNDGRGGFSASNLGKAPARTYSAALADVDGDGHLDVVVSNDAPDRKLVYRNDGKGHLTEIGTFGEPAWTTRYVTLADLNGDSFPDIVAANRGDFPDIGAANPRTVHPSPELRVPEQRQGSLSDLPVAAHGIRHIDCSGGF